jgi:hypothetical protein
VRAALKSAMLSAAALIASPLGICRRHGRIGGPRSLFW